MENTIRAFFDNSMYKEMINSFPKQLQQLIEGENEIVEWNSAGSFHKTLLVNFDELQTFLTSSESTFPQIRCIQDFLHVLNLHGFQKYTWVDKKFSGCHRFSHPNFVNKGATENLFEELVPLSMEEMESSKLLKNHKRLSSNIHYLEKLRKAERRKISGHPRNKAKIAEMRAKYMVDKKNVLKKAKAVGKEKLALEQFNVLCREPKYMEEKQMAGCYGNVSLEMLKVAFTSFEPSYQLADDDAKSTISDDTNEAEDEVVTFNISEIPMALDLGSDVEEQDFVEVVEDRREPFKELQNIMDDNPQEDVKMDFDDYQF